MSRSETPDCFGSRYLPYSCAAAAIMSSDAVLNLSVLELLRALNEKLGLECTTVREGCFLPILDPISAEAEVSGPRSIHLNEESNG